jgi:pimeloyl-ACP methyl ester carboxylesterase
VTVSKQRISFRGSDGLELVADAWGDSGDPPALLLHGGGQTRHAWAGTGEVLAREGWYAVSMDLRGHGESEWCPNGDYRHTSFAADTAAVARSFRTPPVLVGASLGGISSLFALGHAAEAGQPPIARALVLVDIATRMEIDGAKRIIEFMGSNPDGFANLDEAADAIAGYNPHRPRPKDPSGLAKNLRLQPNGRYRWHWDPAFIEGRFQTDALLELERLDAAARGLTIPTLLVRGRMSDLLSESGAREFLEQVPHAHFVDVSGAGHMVAGDRNDKFTLAVVDFLREQVAKPSHAAS